MGKREVNYRQIAEKNNDLYRTPPETLNKSLKLTLPLPPSVNKIYFNTRGGGRRLTKSAENYIRISRALMNLAIEEQRWSMPEAHTWLYLDMVFYFPDRRLRDSHNCLKILLDAMESIVFQNDMYALPRIQSVELDKENPRVEIRITPQTKNAREKGLKLV